MSLLHRRPAAKLAITAIILSITLSLFIWWQSILQWPAQILIRDDQPEKHADYIVLMMGDVIDRTPHAARLYHDGFAKKIIFAEAEYSPGVQQGFRLAEGTASYQYLLNLGVPPEDLIFLEHSRNTSSEEEVKRIVDYIASIDPSAKRLILVTSWYHSSRAFWILQRRVQSSLQLESSPSPAPENFWQDEQAFLMVFNEYLKWVYYLLRY
ncbi:MAG: YdcF family protein [Oligoflexus sp.]